MKRLLIINQDQFGYGIDPYQYCKYLRDEFRVTYVCWDYGLPRMSMDGVEVIYISREGGKVRRLSGFISEARRILKERRHDLCFLTYFPLCAFVAAPRFGNDVVLDFRTGYVRDRVVKRLLANFLMTVESQFFANVTVISEGLRRMLGIRKRKCHLLPLGADPVDVSGKDFGTLRMLYVGSLDFRRIHETVEGLGRFMRDSGDGIDLRYDIVGFGSPEEESRLQQAIAASGWASKIVFHGRVTYDNLAPFLKHANVGVAYIPRETRYDVQPPTKLFEYLLAGMVVLATRTTENSRVIDAENGVLIDDNPVAFAEGLKRVTGLRQKYSSARIQERSREYSWESIVNRNLRPYLRELLRRRAV